MTAKQDLFGMTARPATARPAPRSRQPAASAAAAPPATTSTQRMQALGRLKTGAMNKTEERYAAHLEELRRAGEILWFKFEAMKFRLADNTFYSPDFSVLRSDGRIEQLEVKGFWQDDARVKIKVAAELHPMRFIAVTARPKNLGGGWDVEEF